MRKRARLLALVTTAAIAPTGCATILSGTNQTVTFNSYPPGAHVQAGRYTGTTPVTLSLPKGRDYAVQVSQGPDKRVIPLTRTLDPLTLLNLIPPLWPGFIVDAASGAITKYEPDVVSVDFRTTSGAAGARLARAGE